jgi:peptide/nickel transport system ATP-binding protein
VSDVLLEVEGLSVAFGREDTIVSAVRNASLTLHRGEVLGVAGESGSGKSTLAFALTQLLKGDGRVTAGTAHWHGDTAGPVDLLTADPAALRRIRWAGISIVFQSAMNALNPVLTVGRQLDVVLRAHRPDWNKAKRAERSKELLQMVGIPPERVKAFPHELSGGMRQRTMIAIALALNPQLVILDEPTTALDVVMQRQVLSEIDRLRREFGFAVIFITHDLSLLIEAADNILVMYAGGIVETASAADLYHHPMHPYSQGLLRSFPKVQGDRVELTGIPGNPPDAREVPAGCPFHPRCYAAMDRCRSEPPRLVQRRDETGAERRVACLLYEELQLEGAASHDG